MLSGAAKVSFEGSTVVELRPRTAGRLHEGSEQSRQ